MAQRKKGGKPTDDSGGGGTKGKAGRKELMMGVKGGVRKQKGNGGGKLPKGAAPPRKFKGDAATRSKGKGGKGGKGGGGRGKRR